MLSENTVKILQKLAERLRTNPTPRFNMKYWGSRVEKVNTTEYKILFSSSRNDHSDSFGAYASGVLEDPPCKTQACLAGELCLMEGLFKIAPLGGLIPLPGVAIDIELAARLHLRLSIDQADRLFQAGSSAFLDSDSAWPGELQTRYDQASTPQERCEVAADRIDLFIQSGGNI